ncbi:MAG: helix-turn-helix domain-containing protein [Odoribacteraceae bacterium]|jgi:signal transduction histidine kinase/ligand-binding sensor domain-containing protein/AraC-like DNA-binding protein/CheY-like chemotaxis protein|nr:helix-turn-helix domain-containing protein [Odoribacteraceae bacterium]
MKAKTCFFLYCLFLATPGRGGDLSFRHYTTREGLSNNNVLCMIQDASGYIWCGTPDGLSRFDSKNFRTYRHVAGDSTSLGNNNVHALHEASNGEIWVGTENGVYRLDPYSGRFIPFPLPHEHPDGECNVNCRWRKNIVYSIKEDHEQRIWISTYGNGLYCHDLVTGASRHYLPCSIPSDLNTKILVDREGVAWVASNGHGLCKYIPDEDRFAPVTLRDEASGREARSVYALCEDSSGNIWACDNGLFKYDRARQVTTSYLADHLRNVHFITAARDGMLYIGSDVGLTIYDPVGNRGETLSSRDRLPAGLNDDFVYSILEDREGGLWVGTYCGGVNYSPGSPVFEFYPQVGEEGESAGVPAGRIVNELHEGPDGTIWIGTDDRGLFRFSPRDKNFASVSLGERDIKVQALHADEEYLWIGTYRNGIFRLSPATGKIRHYPGEMPGNMPGIDARSVYSFYKDSEGRLWIGAQTGVFTYDARSDSFSMVVDLGFNSYVERIEEDGRGDIWIASQGKGLISISQGRDSITFHSNERTGLPEMVPAFCIMGDKLLVGTAGSGLYTYDPRRGTCERDANPLFDTHGNILSIIPGDNELWLVTSNGLLRYNADGSSRLYDEEDGLHCHPFSTNAWLRASSGHVYIGGSNGFNRFLPREIRDNDTAPRVAFTAFRLSSESAPRPLDKRLAATLEHDQSGFTIEFVATSFRTPSKNKYKYMLQGFDKTWSYTGNHDNKATYTNLSPGEYLFRVTACNDDGRWNPLESCLRVTILPPWWNTGIARAVYGLLLLCALVAVYLLLLKRLKRAHANKIEMMRYENERDLAEARFSLFTSITHEIRTPLSLILAPVEAILQRDELPDEVLQEDLNAIKKNSERLLELSNQVLDFAKVEQDLYLVKNETFDLAGLVETITRRLAPAARRQGTRVETSFPENLPLLFSDREALAKMIGNLLANAIKSARDHVRVAVEEEPGGDALRVIVEDNGDGVSEEEREKIFTLFYQEKKGNDRLATGVGLAIVRLLAARMNIAIRVESERNAFTRFSLVIPAVPPAVAGAGKQAAETRNGEETTPEKKEGTVLIVEENEEFIVYLVRVFSRKYHVCTAPDGQKALALLKENTVDLIISNFAELCGHVKNDIHLSHIPVVLLVARGDAKFEGLERVTDACIEKPVSANYLYARVTSLLANRNKLRGIFAGKPFEPIRSIAGNQADERWFDRLNECIRENLSNPDFSIDQLARLAGSSRTLLYAKVKAVTGLTPNDFIRLTRLKKAAEHLREGKYKVNEISLLVGFNTPSYFARCFQAQFGVLPKEFMEQQYSRKL